MAEGEQTRMVRLRLATRKAQLRLVMGVLAGLAAIVLGGRMVWFSQHDHELNEWLFVAGLIVVCGWALYDDEVNETLQLVLPFARKKAE